MDISFKVDPEIIIGEDTISLAGTICSRYGERIMIAADQDMDSQTVNRLKEILVDSRLEAIVFDGIQEDSPVSVAENIVDLACAAHCNVIIGLGGPKAQIIARMAALMAPLRMSAFDLMEGRECMGKFLPFVAIPTTGIDPFTFTEYFVAADPRDRLVKKINSPGNLYAAVILDSALFHFVSGFSAGASVFDGFCSAIEAYCSSKASFLSDALLERALLFYAKLLNGGADGIDVSTFTQAGFLTALGAAISSPGTGAALSFAVSARFPAVKRLCSAALLPAIAERLVKARPEKMARVASFLGNAGKTASVADAANSVIEGISRCMEAMKVPANLKEYKIPLDRLTAAAEAARNLEFIPNSPWTVTEEDVFDMLKKIF
jgi:alcohol dehydrogenase class IV